MAGAWEPQLGMGLPSSFLSGELGWAQESSSSGPRGLCILSSAALPAQQHCTRPLLSRCFLVTPNRVPAPGWTGSSLLQRPFFLSSSRSPLQRAPRKTRDPILERRVEEGWCEFLSSAGTSHPEKQQSICSPVLYPGRYVQGPVPPTHTHVTHHQPSILFLPTKHLCHPARCPRKSLGAPRSASQAHTLLSPELSQQVSALHGRKPTQP